MDWNVAVERNQDKLKRILAALVAMAGLSESRTHLPRRLHRAVLRLLRPAEAAARRLIIVAARGLIVTLPKRRAPAPQPKKSSFARHGAGTGIVPPRGMTAAQVRALMTGGDGDVPARPAMRCLPLADPRSNFFRGPARRRYRLASVQHSLLSHDELDATRLGGRLAALGDVLDNLPAHAKRFARWRAARDAAGAQNGGVFDAAGAQNQEVRDAGRVRRLSPLKPGRPPGSVKKPTHEVHEVLADLHAFAFSSLQGPRPDTS